MIRQEIEEYLDGELEPLKVAAIQADPSSAEVLSQARRERAIRAAVYAGYEPSAAEAGVLAAKIVAACADNAVAAAPASIGYIGPWLRRGAAVAAGLALVIAAFAVGRASAPKPQVGPAVASAEIIRVLYSDDAGEPAMKEFDNMDDANGFMKEMTARHAEPVVVASTLDTDHPGSF
jgi:hypothetical protein